MADESTAQGPVAVFDTRQESEAMVVRSLLESQGIEARIVGEDVPQDVLPGVGGVVVWVSADQAEAARKVIEEYNNTETAEPVDDDEPLEPA
ncbi:MAG TPA: DUF2007 domain-containing protein [Verrucomicrobiae bacterium]|jgi:hypothetical protein|nr:DUF2007 domain-containing protein [Verrucomicrobiae bacterium]